MNKRLSGFWMRLASVTARFFSTITPSAEDVLCLLGVAILSFGVFLIHPPSAFIVLGILLLAGGCAIVWAKNTKTGDPA